jgi:hypothetical protein
VNEGVVCCIIVEKNMFNFKSIILIIGFTRLKCIAININFDKLILIGLRMRIFIKKSKTNSRICIVIFTSIDRNFPKKCTKSTFVIDLFISLLSKQI